MLPEGHGRLALGQFGLFVAVDVNPEFLRQPVALDLVLLEALLLKELLQICLTYILGQSLNEDLDL